MQLNPRLSRAKLLRDVKYHTVYRALVEAVTGGKLQEPFGQADFRRVCPGFADGTYRAFLWKHSGGGSVPSESLLLERIAPGRFRLARPFKDDF
jgi:hypothetical protein